MKCCETPIAGAGLKPAPRFRALAVAMLSLAGLPVLSGCPEQAKVTVTIMPDAGAAATDSAGSASESTEAAGFGTLVGTVTFDGSPPALEPLVKLGDKSKKDPDVCAAVAIPDESLVVNTASKGIANVVIFLDKRPLNIKPDLAKPPDTAAIFDQKGCRFFPHILPVQAGQPLKILSGDSIPHNTHTYPKKNKSFNQTISANDRAGVDCNYDKSENAPLQVTCDLHTWMKAYHFPVDHPYVAVTDENGKFRIEGLPAGKHSFNVWHERGSQLLDRKLQITINVDQETEKDLTYGRAKFAGLPQASTRTVAYERLLEGGEITVTRREGQR